MASTQTLGQGRNNVRVVPVATTKLKHALGPPPRYEDIGRYRRIRQGARRRNNLHECDSVPHDASSTKGTPKQALDGSHLVRERKRSGEATSPPYRGGRKSGTHGHGRHQETANTCVRAVDVKQRGASTRSFTPITTRKGRSRNEGRVRDQRFNSADPPTLHRPPPPTYEESRKQSKYYATATGSPKLQFEVSPSSAHSKGKQVVRLGRDSRAGTIGSDANRIFRKGNRTHGVISKDRDAIRTTRITRGEGGNREGVDNIVKEGKRAQSEKLKGPQRPVGKIGRSTSASSVDMASREKAKTLSCAKCR